VSHPSTKPPRGLGWLLERVLGAEETEVRLGDLEEELERAGTSAVSAGLWYWRQVAAILGHELRARLASRGRPVGRVRERAHVVGVELMQSARSLRREPGFTLAMHRPQVAYVRERHMLDGKAETGEVVGHQLLAATVDG